MPYEITDLATVWVLADVYETDLAQREGGDAGHAHPQGVPGPGRSRGRSPSSIPILDPKTRTAKVRARLRQPQRRAASRRCSARSSLRAAPRAGAAHPADAVIDSGTRKVVFVALGEGKFQPREVQLGAGDGDHVEVLEGLRRASRWSPAPTSWSTPSRGCGPRSQAHRRGEQPMIQRDHPLLAPRTGTWCSPRTLRRAGDRLLDDAATSRSTPCPTSPTPRSSSTRAGTAARTSSRTRSPIRSSPRCSARRRVKAIRGFSDFGFSYVYVIFEDGTDLYWARSRVLEYLSKITAAAAGRGEDRARPRRHQRGLGLPVRAGGPERASTRSDELRSLPGLVPALRAPERARRRRGGHRRRPGAPVPDHRQPQRAGRLQAPARRGHPGGAHGATTTWAAGWSSSPAASTWCAAAAT